MHTVSASLIKEFTDQEIGRNYYTEPEVNEMAKRSLLQGESASLILLDDHRVRAVRISYPPRQWQHGKGQLLSSRHWPWPMEKTAYFQSLFVARDLQRRGWGTQLSKKSLRLLKRMGALGVVCHSWVESPGDSSRQYLQSLNFKSIARYPDYWKTVNYHCPRCGQPCLCTAEEMYLNLKEESP
jgi:ribosomal protein S18 acetylase RimI-like enzyme